LPAPIAHAPLVAIGKQLYFIGGRDRSGVATARILRVDPRSGIVAVAGRLPNAVEDAAAVPLTRRAIVLGGGTAAVFELRSGGRRLSTCR
jgi:hypothetical protein